MQGWSESEGDIFLNGFIIRMRCRPLFQGESAWLSPMLVKQPISARPPNLSFLLFSQVSKCLIEFQTRQLHRSLGDRSLSLLAADSVLKETDKNSESFTVHRSLAQACFDPTPAATAAATPTATPYFNAIKIQKEGRRERIRKRNFCSG